VTSIALTLVLVPFVNCGSYALPYIPATYDYIVIGGGTAGLIIASQLAANSSISVAIIEARGLYENDNPPSIIPGHVAIQSTGWDPTDLEPLIKWGFVTTSQLVSGNPYRWHNAKLCLQGLKNIAIHYAHEKAICSTLARHFLVYQRYFLALLTHSCSVTYDAS